MNKLLPFLCLIFLGSCSQPKPDGLSVLNGGHWIDMTWNYDENTVYWPTNVTFKHDTVFYGINDKGYFYSSLPGGAVPLSRSPLKN
jgi:hypothetical protein